MNYCVPCKMFGDDNVELSERVTGKVARCLD